MWIAPTGVLREEEGIRVAKTRKQIDDGPGGLAERNRPQAGLGIGTCDQASSNALQDISSMK